MKRHLPAAIAGDDHGVHQARVATRRLREAVPVLARGLKKSKAGKARRKIRRLTRALGSVRETDVSLRILADLAQTGTQPRTAIEEIRAHVIDEREKRRALMLDRLKEVNVAKLSRRLESVADALQSTTSQQWRDTLSARLLKRSHRLAETIGQAGQMYAPERLHAVRIASKKLRYALELAADARITGAPALLRPIKRMQDLLGRLHDLQVLQRHVADVQAQPAASRAGMHSALESVSRQLEEECRHLHAQYLKSTAGLKDVCDRIAKDVVPHLQMPAVRRALKMSLVQKPVKPVRAAAGGRH